MQHDAERDAARLLGSAMDPVEREDFSQYRAGCHACRSGVRQGRRGRRLAASTRTAAPGALRDRDRVRVMVEAEPTTAPFPSRRRAMRRCLAPVSVPVAAAAAAALIIDLRIRHHRTAVAAAGGNRHLSGQLPGAQLPAPRAPNLSGPDLSPVGAGGGTCAGLDVDSYAYRVADYTHPVDGHAAYRHDSGRRIVLSLSEQAFPQAPGARRLAGEDGWWVAQRGHVTVLCARLPPALLAGGQDDQLVRQAASALEVL